MTKVSFRMASASRESVFGVQTSTARKIIGQAHRGPVDHDAKQMLRTKGTGAGTPSRGARPGSTGRGRCGVSQLACAIAWEERLGGPDAHCSVSKQQASKREFR